MIDLGIVKPGSTLFIPFASYAGSTGASITLTGLAVTDIEIYKDGSMTQRGSDAGYTLLDTDGIDLDTITGIHGFSIDLADNTTAGFYAAGSRYYVVVSAVTIDSQTVNFVAASFVIGLPGAVLSTTIDTLTTQVSFTLVAGPAEDDALNGCVVYIHDVASAVQGGFAVVSDYTGATKTVTLTAGVTFTAAATDNVMVMPPSNLSWWATVAPNALISGRVDASVGAMAADVITAASTNADFLAEVNAEVVDALATDTYAEPTGVPAATASLASKIGRIHQALRNKITVTASKKIFFDDADAALWEKDLSDDATTYTETEGNAP